MTPSATPDIDFSRIRAHGNPPSRAGGFEELSSILIEQRTDWPSGTKFERFGNPDGGREGHGVLPNGDVWAWQSKYLFKFDSDSAGQVKHSFERVLELEPRLTKYLVAMPCDRPAGDTKKSKSAFTRWGEEVENWQALAAAKGLTVEFIFVGEHEMMTALTHEENAGRLRYWFGTNVMTIAEQQDRIDEVAAKLGPRYSPQLHVEVSAVQVLEGIGRTPSYAEQWQRVLAGLRSARIGYWSAPAADADKFSDALAACKAALDDTDAALQRVVDSLSTFTPMPQPDIQVTTALTAVRTVLELLHRHSRSSAGYLVDEAAFLSRSAQDALSALVDAHGLCGDIAMSAARDGQLLMTGRAGVGKSHLLCDVARRRVEANRPTIMILGQDFDDRSLLPQIPELAETASSTDELLMLLDAAAEATGNTSLLIIDAVNESDKPARWPDAARALQTKVARFPRVALVMSCRSEFVEDVIGDLKLPKSEHKGFDESVDIAIQRFAEVYGIDAPTFPVLNTEFNNALYLRLTCEALSELGTSRFILGAAGLTVVSDAFIEAMNQRLSAAARCDFDRHDNLVQAAIDEIVKAKGPYWRSAEISRITKEILPRRSWSESLMKGMLDEGVLIRVGGDRIAFGYQRLGDIARAKHLTGQSLSEIKAWLIDPEKSVHRERGVLSTLAILLPETHDVELVDLMAEGARIAPYLVDGFIESLTLRDAAVVSEKTKSWLNLLLTEPRFASDVWSQLVRLACLPSHPLNAVWLHDYLSAQLVADRDATWTTFLSGALDLEAHSPVRTLLEWVWPVDADLKATLSPQTTELSTLLLGWFTTASDRAVRDHATKALVAVGEAHPQAFAVSLSRLLKVNDPYVLERVAGAACGIALRSGDEAGIVTIAEKLAVFVFPGWPKHLLTRDYIRRVFDRASRAGFSVPPGPAKTQWTEEASPLENIEEKAAAPEHLYSSVCNSLNGDFGRYIVEPSIRDLHVPDEEAFLELAKRLIFDRVIGLGWTPEKLGEFDKRLRHARSQDSVERFGKKYQWIGFYEVLGMMTDAFAVRPEWGATEAAPYEYPEQLIYRDIDVTVLVREPSGTSRSLEAPWFSPAAAVFPVGVVTDYPSDASALPDPLELLSVTDFDGDQWLCLISNPHWKQRLPPEVEALKPPTRESWMQLHAYLVSTSSLEDLRVWAVGKDWYGRWMPDYAGVANVLLGSHPFDPGWADAAGEVDEGDVPDVNGRPPLLTQVGAWYGGTGTDRDASGSEETRAFVPSRALFEALGLHHGKDFRWSDDDGVAVYDPSPAHGGQNVLLLRRSLAAQLERAGISLFWTVLAESDYVPRNHGMPGKDIEWVSASASYIFVNGQIEKLDSQAGRLSRGPRRGGDVAWPIKIVEA
ncbi:MULTISPECIES: hypothetical protein [unclassified Frigoribacterium]|uniref:hypothetical protein n=1 Tax=unclassified Frigoribacterium TaxID=2627005 RepID=UPI0015652D85|nr:MULTISPECIES: hypothetical protein [unclassified Frigoribacterium]NQW87682.1 hypothetical protein [Frigoribacterium sp. VKM Ac-2860]NQX09509.1 hypothetical protein [Frigoribacterium sp. VKM Ac-2859]